MSDRKFWISWSVLFVLASLFLLYVILGRNGVL